MTLLSVVRLNAVMMSVVAFLILLCLQLSSKSVVSYFLCGLYFDAVARTIKVLRSLFTIVMTIACTIKLRS
jgi:hypothetical protein